LRSKYHRKFSSPEKLLYSKSKPASPQAQVKRSPPGESYGMSLFRPVSLGFLFSAEQLLDAEAKPSPRPGAASSRSPISDQKLPASWVAFMLGVRSITWRLQIHQPSGNLTDHPRHRCEEKHTDEIWERHRQLGRQQRVEHCYSQKPIPARHQDLRKEDRQRWECDFPSPEMQRRPVKGGQSEVARHYAKNRTPSGKVV